MSHHLNQYTSDKSSLESSCHHPYLAKQNLTYSQEEALNLISTSNASIKRQYQPICFEDSYSYLLKCNQKSHCTRCVWCGHSQHDAGNDEIHVNHPCQIIRFESLSKTKFTSQNVNNQITRKRGKIKCIEGERYFVDACRVCVKQYTSQRHKRVHGCNIDEQSLLNSLRKVVKGQMRDKETTLRELKRKLTNLNVKIGRSSRNDSSHTSSSNFMNRNNNQGKVEENQTKAPNVLLQAIDVFIKEEDPLQVLRKEYHELDIYLSQADINSVGGYLKKAYREYSDVLSTKCVLSDLEGVKIVVQKDLQEPNGQKQFQVLHSDSSMSRSQIYSPKVAFNSNKQSKQVWIKAKADMSKKIPNSEEVIRSLQIKFSSQESQKNSQCGGDEEKDLQQSYNHNQDLAKNQSNSPSASQDKVQIQIPILHNDGKPFTQNCLSSIDQVRLKASLGYYHTYSQFLADIEYLFKYTYTHRCKNQIARFYIWRALNRILTIFQRYKSKFLQFKSQDFKQIKQCKSFQWKFKDPNDKYWKKIPPRRYFQKLDDFIPACQKDKEYIQDKLRTKKLSLCNGQNCKKQQDLGEIDINFEKWQSNCKCRALKMECNNECPCSAQCRNQGLSSQKYKELGDGLEAVPCWGFDKYVHRMLFSLFPDNITETERNNFIEKDLARALQYQGEHGWNIKNSLIFIIQVQKNRRKQEQYCGKVTIQVSSQQRVEIEAPVFSEYSVEFAQILLEGVKTLGIDCFKIYSKGIGVICSKPQGISSNQLIAPYFGQIYPPWRWYEKQDIIKKGQKEGRLSSELTDFYNIMLDRHKDDPDGFDVLYVDPIIKGSFSSRLSHSCSPNCSTVVMVANPGRKENTYSIGMYAIKSIKLGEQLTFDYNSVTQQEQEWRNAICLCGSQICRGSYLGYTNFNFYLIIQQTDHKFIERMYILFKAIANTEISPEQFDLMQKYGIRGQRFFERLPKWLLKWAALIVQYIQFEFNQLPKRLKQQDIDKGMDEEYLRMEIYESQAKCLVDARMHNLVITIDKVMRLLKQIGTVQAPVKQVSNIDIMNRMWDDEKACFRKDLIDVMKCVDIRHICSINGNEYIEEKQNIKQLYQTILNKLEHHSIMLKGDGSNDTERFQHVRERLREISFIMRQFDKKIQSLQKKAKANGNFVANSGKLKIKKVFFMGLADILFLTSFVQTYFTKTKFYKKIKSEKIKVRACDVNLSGYSEELTVQQAQRVIYSNEKVYDAAYIWGQISGWFKQTVDKPNASLSAERRGTLSYPDLCSFLYQEKNQKFDRRNKQSSDRFDGRVEDENNSFIQQQQQKFVGQKRNTRDIGVINYSKFNYDENKPIDRDQYNGLDNLDKNYNDDEDDDETCNKRGSKKKGKIKQARKSVAEKSSIFKTYPYGDRATFLTKLQESYSAMWPVGNSWSFKNKYNLYGSVQLESLFKAENIYNARQRTSYLNNIINTLRQIQQQTKPRHQPYNIQEI